MRALIAVVLITVFQLDQLLPAIQCVQDLAPGTCRSYRRRFRVPVPWFQSIDGLVSILAVPGLFWLWRLQATHRGESGEIAKIGIGAWIAAASHLILVAAIVSAKGARIHPIWPTLCCVGMLALVSRAAPACINATMMGIAFLSLFLANNIIGWLGRLYERMDPAPFWLLHAGIASTGGLWVLLFGRRLSECWTQAHPSRCAHRR